MPWREKKYHCGGDSWQGGLFTKQLKKRVKAVFLCGCCGCIFHGTGNSAQLCQNFGISGGGKGLKPPSLRYAAVYGIKYLMVLEYAISVMMTEYTTSYTEMCYLVNKPGI